MAMAMVLAEEEGCARGLEGSSRTTEIRLDINSGFVETYFNRHTQTEISMICVCVCVCVHQIGISLLIFCAFFGRCRLFLCFHTGARRIARTHQKLFACERRIQTGGPNITH